MDNIDQNVNNLENSDINNEIDLNAILESIIRKKNLFFSVATSVLFFSFLYAFTRKPIWEGQFQIVLSQGQKSSVSNELLSSFANKGIGALGNNILSSTNSSLNTEIEILQSPAVLKPIFDFVKDQKEKKGKNISNFRFNDWSQSISIGLRPKTTVLDLFYRDNDKELILPVINKISDAYKDYPDRDKNKSLYKRIKYLEDQISFYSDLSAKSFRNYANFSLENDLPSISPINPSPENIRNTIFAANPEFKLKNQIKSLKLALNEIENINLEKYNDKILPLDLYLPNSRDFAEMSSVIKKQVSNLKAKRENFTEEDRVVKSLKKNIRNLNYNMHSNAKDYLKQKIKINENKLKIVEIPKDLLIKAKELQREIIRLENIVSNFENNKQLLSLQLSENQSPWELISKPTLSESPVYPRKKQIVFLGFISGIILGIAASLYIENLSGLIFNLKEFKYLIKYKFLKEVDINDESDVEDSITLIGNNINQISNIKKTGLFIISDLLDKEIDKFSMNLIKSLDNINLVKSNDFSVLSKCDSIILILKKGVVTRKQLAKYDQKLKLLNLPILGWVFLNS